MAEITITEQTKGRGHIPVHVSLMKHLWPDLQEPTFGTAPYTKMEADFAALHKRLLLPEHYSVVGLFLDVLRRTWHVIVEGDDIPVVHEAMEMPLLVPSYRYNEDHVAELVGIRIEA